MYQAHKKCTREHRTTCPLSGHATDLGSSSEPGGGEEPWPSKTMSNDALNVYVTCIVGTP